MPPNSQGMIPTYAFETYQNAVPFKYPSIVSFGKRLGRGQAVGQVVVWSSYLITLALEFAADD